MRGAGQSGGMGQLCNASGPWMDEWGFDQTASKRRQIERVRASLSEAI
jgi:hypothetical protein